MTEKFSRDVARLRLITYLSPGVDVAVFELIMSYLEEVVGRPAYLIHESRWSGPPPRRIDPFTLDDVDIGFMCSAPFLRMLEEGNKFVELCQAGTIHEHPNSGGRPVYYSDVIVHKSNEEKFKTLDDLKGCRWAFNEELSLSGNLVVLHELRKMGLDASFFGDKKKSGGHLKSISMVLDHLVDASAIDSNTLSNFFRKYPEKKEELVVITSFGPMPIYPIVFNSRLPGDVKEQITQALWKMPPEWLEKFSEYGITGFESISMSLYDMEKQIKSYVGDRTITNAYY